MAIERWGLKQPQRDKVTAADIVGVLRTPYGDAPLVNYLSLEEFRAQKQKTLSRFFDREIVVPTPPQELLIAMLKAREIGWFRAEAHFLPKRECKQDSNFPGWTVRPENWYWRMIREGKVAQDAATLEEGWIIIDGSQKPQYENGKQMYKDDPFARVLSQLRKDGKIQVPNWCRHIPKDSRFGASPGGLEDYFNSAIASLLGVEPGQAKIPKIIELNVLGNLSHPEWGETNTWEWSRDKFRAGFRLIGGDSDDGGLANVYYDICDSLSDSIGFRPLLVFPPKVR